MTLKNPDSFIWSFRKSSQKSANNQFVALCPSCKSRNLMVEGRCFTCMCCGWSMCQ